MVSRLTLDIKAVELKKIEYDSAYDALSREYDLALELSATANKAGTVMRETIAAWGARTSSEACMTESTKVFKEAVGKFEAQCAVVLKMYALNTAAYEAYMEELPRSWRSLELDNISSTTSS